ncbi:MAG: RidA family protein [Microbacterium sp.]
MSENDVKAVPRAMGPYSTVRRAGDFLFLSGQGGLDPVTSERAEGIHAETRTALANVELLLNAEGFALQDLVQVTCYLTDLADWPRMNEAFTEYLGEVIPPTRTAVGVASLAFGLSFELTCVAYRSGSGHDG